MTSNHVTIIKHGNHSNQILIYKIHYIKLKSYLEEGAWKIYRKKVEAILINRRISDEKKWWEEVGRGVEIIDISWGRGYNFFGWNRKKFWSHLKWLTNHEVVYGYVHHLKWF